jgi:choline kinase
MASDRARDLTGIVLAAGPGRRLHPLTAALPKTLLPLADGRTILDLAVGNLSSVGIEEVVVVGGFAADRIRESLPEIERRYGVRLELVFNHRALEWNNAYSLWLAREAFRGGALLVNGDTVHPVSVEENLLSARGADVLLAVDDVNAVGEEEMKVLLAENGGVLRIAKHIDAAAADGEYIGVALVEPAAAETLADALEATWRRDPSLYYEDGCQEFVDRGGNVQAVSIGGLEWIEVDDHSDLARAREIQCRY